jgi:hypothetical protein
LVQQESGTCETGSRGEEAFGLSQKRRRVGGEDEIDLRSGRLGQQAFEGSLDIRKVSPDDEHDGQSGLRGGVVHAMPAVFRPRRWREDRQHGVLKA